MKDTYYLVRIEDDCIVGKFEVDKADKRSVTGNCYSATGWLLDRREPIDWDFIADVYCKWDSCTHWNFRGEDYDPEINKDEPGDNYYHLCGEEYFTNHIRMMCFVWVVVSSIMEMYRTPSDSIFEEYFGNETTVLLVNLMLNQYKIERAEVADER